MKRISNLYEHLLDVNRIKEIIILASKGKKKRKEVMKVLNNIDYYANEILEMLKTQTYYMKPYHKRNIVENGKVRELTISPFYPNRILDYIIVETLKPYIRKSMYEYCIGNVDKRGMIYGKNIIAKKYKKYKYYIKLDIHKFYPSVKSYQLYNFIETKIKDKRMLDLIKCVITQTSDMPIGSYYSQWFSNWFLQDLDHKIKEVYRIPFYIRYVDDMLLMGNNKRKLLNAMYNINAWLNNHELKLKRIEQVYTIEQRPIDFLGFRFCENKIILRTRNFKQLNKRLKKIKRNKHICVSQARSLLSYIGWLKQIKLGYLYYINHIKEFIKIGELKQIVSNYDKKENKESIYYC